MSNLHPDLTFTHPTTQMHSNLPISSIATERLIYQHHTSMPPRTQAYPPWPPTSSIPITPLPPSFTSQPFPTSQPFLISSASVAPLAEFFTELHGDPLNANALTLVDHFAPPKIAMAGTNIYQLSWPVDSIEALPLDLVCRKNVIPVSGDTQIRSD